MRRTGGVRYTPGVASASDLVPSAPRARSASEALGNLRDARRPSDFAGRPGKSCAPNMATGEDGPAAERAEPRDAGSDSQADRAAPAPNPCHGRGPGRRPPCRRAREESGRLPQRAFSPAAGPAVPAAARTRALVAAGTAGKIARVAGASFQMSDDGDEGRVGDAFQVAVGAMGRKSRKSPPQSQVHPAGRSAGRSAGPIDGGRDAAVPTQTRLQTDRPADFDLTARRQDRAFQARSRVLRANRGGGRVYGGTGGAWAHGAHAAQAAGEGSAGALRALVAGTGAGLAPLVLAALAVAAAVLVVAGLVGAVLSAGFFGMQQGSYSSMARIALAEYEGGVLDGFYHHDDPKYWAYATGSAYSDGSSTPWCAAFVSWCANECGYVDSGLFPRTAGVGTILAHFEADSDLGSVVDLADYDSPRPGDIVCYGSASSSGGSCTDHVGIVVSVGGSESEGYSYFYTVEGNTSSDGTGGDSARVGRHVFWNNRAGIAESPQWQLSYWDYAKVIRPNYPEAAHGDIKVPETFEADGVTYRVGTFATREWDPGAYSFDAGSDAWRVEQAWRARGAAYDARGFSTIDGKYLVACTAAFGAVGDEIVFYFDDDGTRLDCVMADTKDQTAAHGTPATVWGHRDFASRQIGVLEFLGSPAIGDNPYVALGLQGSRVVGATNMGRYV